MQFAATIHDEIIASKYVVEGNLAVVIAVIEPKTKNYLC